ncbi:MAG: exonuclease, partial [Geminicoccaceae bacterium]|nr:exonuclease [Geminicoccaceae bacterium]
CHTFITESTFGLPIYRWTPDAEVFDAIRAWWRMNREQGRASVLFGYALGKAQRLLAGLADADIGPIYTHGAVERLNRDYRAGGVRLAETQHASAMPRGHDFAGSLIVAPPSAAGSTWMRRFGTISTGFASGWMRVRGMRRRRAIDRGFVLSDHVDWPSLLAAVEGTRAERVWVTHGTREPLVRWLTERGIEAKVVASLWKGEEDTDPVEVAGEEISA